jgi:hypothetical protein
VEWTEFAGFATPHRDACFRTAHVNEVVRSAGDSFAERRRVIFYYHTQEMQFAESLGATLARVLSAPNAGISPPALNPHRVATPSVHTVGAVARTAASRVKQELGAFTLTQISCFAGAAVLVLVVGFFDAPLS